MMIYAQQFTETNYITACREMMDLPVSNAQHEKELWGEKNV